MDRLDKLEQDAQALLAEARDLLATITTEERNAAPEEDTRFSAIEFEVSCLAAEYESLKRARDLAEKAHADLGKPGSTSGSERGEDRGAPAVHLDVDPFDAAFKVDLPIIDGLVNGVARVFKESGSRVRVVQSGFVRSYAVAFIGGLLLVVVWLLVAGGA